MQDEGTYRYGEDAEREADRLTAVEAAFDPMTRCLLLGVGVSSGWRCWEVGAGNGSIARWLAGVVGGEGAVLATDLDERGHAPGGHRGIAFLSHDVLTDPIPGGGFDLVHARFLLEHLPDPRRAIDRLRDALRAGGVLALEDSAGLQIDAIPASGALDQLAPAWLLAARSVDWDACYGSSLMSDLKDAGLTGLRGHEHRQLAQGGEAWAHLRAGLERLRHELSMQGIDEAKLRRVLDCLADPEVLITGPPVVAATARR